MKKIIKRNIRISTRTRDFVDYVNHEFYSHDKHNAFFEFTMERLPTENIIGLFYFQKTKRYLEKRATVEGNTFTIEFDTSLITTDETVIGFIYFEKVVQSADVHQFSFGVKVSEIDKMQDVPIQEESTKRIVSLEDIVTKAELKELFKTIERTGGGTPIDTTNFATAQSVEAIDERVRTIENTEYAKKTDIPKIDTKNFATKQDLEEFRNNQPVADTSDLSKRISTLENKTDNFISGVSVSKEGSNVTLTYTYVDGQNKNVSFTDSDTINVAYDDSSLREQIKNLESRPQVDVSDFAKKSEVPSMDLFNTLSSTQGDQAIKITALEAKSKYEIHGTGMPNGQVEAPIGTTYVDMEVTNGALKWIKESGSGNTGWKVFTGDTGWRTLPLINKRGSAKLQVRRINDQIIVKFDGLNWGWFGVDDLSRQEGRIVDKTINSKKYTWIKLDVGRGNDVLPQGFRSASSLLTGLYGDLGDLLGSVYVGGTSDSNAIQLRYAMERNALNSNILSQIRISPITFITDDDWPTNLP